MRGPFVVAAAADAGPVGWRGGVLLHLAALPSNATPRGEVKGAPTHAAEPPSPTPTALAALAMQENLDGLLRLADKPTAATPPVERRHSQPRAGALEQLRAAVLQRQPGRRLQGRRDIAAMALALAPVAGDRVAAFIRVHGRHDHHRPRRQDESLLLDGMDAQHLYNAARNVETTAVWLLAQRRNARASPAARGRADGARPAT